MARRRHLSRIAVMLVLFEREKHPDMDGEDALAMNGRRMADIYQEYEEYMAENFPEVKISKDGNYQMDDEFSQSLLKGVLEHEAAVKDAIQRHAPQWPMDRMDPISRSLLLIGGYELLFAKDAPPAVVMNEAIEIAKEYGTDESAKFVNGVLNAVAHKEAGAERTEEES